MTDNGEAGANRQKDKHFEQNLSTLPEFYKWKKKNVCVLIHFSGLVTITTRMTPLLLIGSCSAQSRLIRFVIGQTVQIQPSYRLAFCTTIRQTNTLPVFLHAYSPCDWFAVKLVKFELPGVDSLQNRSFHSAVVELGSHWDKPGKIAIGKKWVT